MKKKSLLYSLLLLGSVSFTGCTDMLEKEPLDTFTDNPLFWNNPSSVEGYANAFYNQFTGYGTSGSGDFYFPSLTDDQVGAGFVNWKYINVPAANSNWSATWDEIRRSNAMIKSLEEKATTMDAATKNHWIGVARMMRAYQYWDLVRKFGDCPWVDHPVDIDDPVLYAAREDRDMIMDKVLEDLIFAVNNIQESTSKTTWSRNMARAMKSHICLWEGTFRKYRSEADHQKAPDLAGAERFLKECVTECEYLMSQYTLSDNYQALYNSVTLTGNPEVIFCKEYRQDVMGHSTINYTCTSTQMNGMSKDAFDSYLFLDGKTKNKTSLNNTDVPELKVSANDGQQHLNINNLLAVRDKRLAQQIDTVLCYPGKPWPRIVDGVPMTASTGYSVAKFDNVSLPVSYREIGSKNYTAAPLYWLSVIYLEFAEAKAELADMGKGTITNDDLNNSINKLKERAGLPAITTTVEDMGDNDMNVSPLIFEIRRERRCELMFDNDFRYWDLIRWHQLDKLDTTKNPDIVLGANVAAAPTAEVELTGDGHINGLDAGFSRTYEYKHYWYPIPSGQISLNKNLTQNPGWEK